MPRLRTIKASIKGADFAADLKVDAAGTFSIVRPGTAEDWPSIGCLILGKDADSVVRQWQKAVIDYAGRQRTERKVLLIKFDSSIREGGKKDFFVDDDALLYLRCCVALETKTKQGDKTNIAYTEHPDYSGFHGKVQPFPYWARFRADQIRAEKLVAVDWSAPLENALVAACKGIQAVVDLLDNALSSPEQIEASAHRLALLPKSK